MMKLRTIIPAFMLLLLAACTGDVGYSNIDNDELQQLLAQGLPLYDIRRPEEWRETGVVKGSQRLTFVDASGQLSPQFMPEFTRKIAKDTPVILICRTGNRSSVLAKYLVEKLGYTHVYNVSRGISGWLGEKRAVSRL